MGIPHVMESLPLESIVLMIGKGQYHPLVSMEIGLRTPTDTKIQECSSPSYKMVSYLHINYLHTFAYILHVKYIKYLYTSMIILYHL